MSAARLTTHWDQLDRDTVRAIQGRQLHKYLRDCVVPFSAHYRKLFADRGLSAGDFQSLDDLKKLPVTSKEDLLPTPESPKRSLDFVLAPEPAALSRRPGVILRALLQGKARVQARLEREWRPVFMTSTTGRSSEPVPFLYSQHDIANMGLGAGRIIELAGVKKEERMINLFPFAPHLAFWYMHYGGMERNIFALATGGGKVMGTDGCLRAILKLSPQILVAMPTFLYHVLQHAVEQKLRIAGVRLLVLGGEKVPDGTRRKLSELCAQLGSPDVQFIVTYGFTEAKLAWGECPVSSGATPPGYHLYPDLGIVEIVDPTSGEPVPDGTGGEIVWTPLGQRGTVVMRYRTGDRSEHGLTYEPCPCCGRRMPRLVGRISRVSEMRALRFQKIKGTIVDFNDLENALDDLPGIGTWQIELRKENDDPLGLDIIILHLACDPDANEADVKGHVSELFKASFELTPNAIEFHSMEKLRKLQKVGVAIKEQKVADNRPDAAKKESS